MPVGVVMGSRSDSTNTISRNYSNSKRSNRSNDKIQGGGGIIIIRARQATVDVGRVPKSLRKPGTTLNLGGRGA